MSFASRDDVFDAREMQALMSLSIEPVQAPPPAISSQKSSALQGRPRHKPARETASESIADTAAAGPVAPAREQSAAMTGAKRTEPLRWIEAWKTLAAPRRAERFGRLAADEVVASGTVFMCSDRAFIPGAIVALSSILRHNRAALRNCRFCVFLSEDAMLEGAPLIAQLAVSYGVTIETLPAWELGRAHTGFRVDWGFLSPGHSLSDAAYYRILAALWFAERGEHQRVLYIDSDTSMGPDLAELLKFDLLGQPLAARYEEADWPGVRRAARKMDVPIDKYFNSGVMVLDLAHPLAAPRLRKALEIAAQSRDLLTYGDQCALNVAFEGLATALPGKFNQYVRRDTNLEALPSGAPVVHYLGTPKPWDPAYPSANNSRWLEEYYALAEIFDVERVRRLLAMPFDGM